MTDSKKKSKKNSSKAAFLAYFIVTFMVAVFVLGIFFKHFSPTVDVNIGQSEFQSDETDNNFELDNRLKWIQDEDNFEQEPTSEKYLKVESDNTLSKRNVSEKKEAVRQKSKVTEVSSSAKNDEIPIPLNTKYITVPPVPTVNEVQNSFPPKNVKITRVYVGFYKNIEDATEAKTKIAQTMPGIQPFIKAVNEQYIVQAGSFTDRSKAVELRDELSNRGYTARLLSD